MKHAHGSEKNHSYSHAEANLGTAFALNLFFAIVELVGGLWTGSMAIVADAIHDFGDSLTLGLALFLQRISGRKRTKNFTYGYARFSLLSAFISGIVIAIGSIFILIDSIPSLFRMDREAPHGLGMMGLAVLGILINGIAALRLKHGKTRNEKVLTWHLLEDLLGWIAVLIGAIVIIFTKWSWVDPFLACLVSLYIIWNVLRNLWVTSKLFLQGTPEDFNEEELKTHLLKLRGVREVHDIHAWSLDGEKNILSLHIVVTNQITTIPQEDSLKGQVRDVIRQMGNFHSTIDVEKVPEKCDDKCE